MIEGINSSKKAFFAWLAVFVVLFVGLSVTWTVINNNSPVAEQATAEQMKMLYLGSFLFALNVALFAIYTAFAIVAGPIMNLYTIISGIIFMCQKKI